MTRFGSVSRSIEKATNGHPSPRPPLLTRPPLRDEEIDAFAASEAGNLTRELARHGYDEDEIAAPWRGNRLRVLRPAEEGRG